MIDTTGRDTSLDTTAVTPPAEHFRTLRFVPCDGSGRYATLTMRPPPKVCPCCKQEIKNNA